MENPFEILNERLDRIELLLLKIESYMGFNELIPVHSKVMDITQ
ncbi:MULTISPECIES: hypothetical protein [unclassified Polaribacter]|nr:MULTISPECIES: hypothetical protein [unclassified Polaribacter]